MGSGIGGGGIGGGVGVVVEVILLAGVVIVVVVVVVVVALWWQSVGVGGVYSFCKGCSCNRCIRAIVKAVLDVAVCGC